MKQTRLSNRDFLVLYIGQFGPVTAQDACLALHIYKGRPRESYRPGAYEWYFDNSEFSLEGSPAKRWGLWDRQELVPYAWDLTPAGWKELCILSEKPHFQEALLTPEWLAASNDASEIILSQSDRILEV